jgi:hypothetical protein
MSLPSCSLSLLVARTDVQFMMQTLPHLVRMCNYPFIDRLLVLDTSELAGDYLKRPGIGTLEQLRDCAQQLLEAGVVDRVVDLDRSKVYRDRIYPKHFDAYVQETHNYRGAPVLGYIFCIEEAKGDYVLFFDSDMLLYQSPDYNWIEAGIQLMQARPEIANVLPLAGPPSDQGGLAYQKAKCEYDPAGFYRFKRFTSRRFMVDRQRFNDLLPLHVSWLNSRRKPRWMPNWFEIFQAQFTGKGGLARWEDLMTERFEATTFFRADLDTPKAWTIHPWSHGEDFIRALPDIIQKIEAGWYPPEQAGQYDLQLKYWL